MLHDDDDDTCSKVGHFKAQCSCGQYSSTEADRLYVVGGWVE